MSKTVEKHCELYTDVELLIVRGVVENRVLLNPLEKVIEGVWMEAHQALEFMGTVYAMVVEKREL